MNVINMTDDFQMLCKEAKVIGNFEVYKHYTMKYPVLFEGVFKGLYMAEIDNLKDLINHVEFERNLKIVQDNEKRVISSGIIKEVEKVASLLKFNKDFDLYLGMELGNIGGFSGPNLNGKPLIYIGLDRKIDETFIKYFVPHEMNHMVRTDGIKEINPLDFIERVITEGLGF